MIASIRFTTWGRALLLAAALAVPAVGSLGCSDDEGADITPPPPPPQDGDVPDSGDDDCVFDPAAPSCDEGATEPLNACSQHVENCTRFNNCRVPGYPNNVPVVP
jgi:hypothetical protein